MIGILDYGVGNIKAFSNIFHFLNIPYRIIKDSKELRQMSRFILPGVGAFDSVMNKLESSCFLEELNEEVIHKKKPFLGVCVGMQILARMSEEGVKPGLDWIPGKVVKFKSGFEKQNVVVPQIGWNTIHFSEDEKIFKNIPQNSRFYFLHSFYYIPEHLENSLSTTDHGVLFSSAVRKNNIFGLQFHPEKSHKNGIILLRNFAEYT
jgi:glutamine amidotransferase